MPLPATIDASLSWSDYKGSQHGPFENGSNLYVVLLDNTAVQVEVWKSTDGGNTWAEQDSANKPTVVSDANHKNLYAIKEGTNLYICRRNSTGSGFSVFVTPFSLSTDTWQSGTGIGSLFIGSHVATASPTFLARRSDGDYVVLYNGATEGIMGTQYRRVNYARHEGSTWTTQVSVAGTGAQIHYDARGILLGSSDRTHLFWTDANNADLKHRTLTSANALQTIQDIDTAMLSQAAYSVGLPVLNGTEIILPFLNELTNTVLAVARGTSADTPTWSVQNVSTIANVPEQLNANPGAVAVDGSTVYVFWPNDADQDIYQDNDAGTGTWGTDTEWKDAITCNGININKISGAIAVLYDDGGTVKYDKLALTGDQTIIASGIATLEAFGTDVIQLFVVPSAITTLEAFGTQLIRLFVTPSGIVTGEAFGSHTIVPGAVSVVLTGIASLEAFGTLVIGLQVVTTGISTAEVFGTPQLNLLLQPTGILTGGEFGTAHLIHTVQPTGIISAEAFGTATVAQVAFIVPTSIPSDEAFGTSVIVLTIHADGIATAEAFGSYTISPGTVTILVSSIDSLGAFGTSLINLALQAIGILSAEEFGIPVLGLYVTPTGITSLEAFGTAQLNLYIVSTGVASDEQFGTAILGSFTIVQPSSVNSLEVFGSHILVPGVVTVLPNGIESLEAFGTASINLLIEALGVASAEAFGTALLRLFINATGIDSAEQFGTPLIYLFLLPTDIPTAEDFGSASIVSGNAILPNGIGSEEAFGTPLI
jgi:hypothetical protein